MRKTRTKRFSFLDGQSFLLHNNVILIDIVKVNNRV